MTLPARAFAATIAATAWTALLWQLVLSTRTCGSLLKAIWIVAEYFTILTNLVVAVVFSYIAFGTNVSERIVAGTMLSILLVGVVYLLLLRGTLDLEGGAVIVDKLMHYTVPALTLIFWLTCTPKGDLTWQDPLLWACYPLAYLGYGMVRGKMTGRYPYFFLDVATLGWGRTVVNAVGIALAFVGVGYLVVGLDRVL